MVKPRLSSADKELLRSVDTFMQKVSESSLDNEFQQRVLVSDLNYLSQDLNIVEYRCLADAWSQFNLTGETTQLRTAADTVFQNFPRKL